MAAGTITAKQMTIRQKTKEYTFVNDVQHQPEARRRTRPTCIHRPARKRLQRHSATPNEPIDITANRLDVNDTAKTAMFTGNVRAKQGKATLTSPELEVTYEGRAVPQRKTRGPKQGTEARGR